MKLYLDDDHSKVPRPGFDRHFTFKAKAVRAETAGGPRATRLGQAKALCQPQQQRIILKDADD